MHGVMAERMFLIIPLIILILCLFWRFYSKAKGRIIQTILATSFAVLALLSCLIYPFVRKAYIDTKYSEHVKEYYKEKGLPVPGKTPKTEEEIE